MKSEFIYFRRLLSRDEKVEFVVNCLLSLLVAINEAFGVGAVVLFISYASDADKISSSLLYKYLQQKNPQLVNLDFLIAFGLFLVAYYFLRSLINIYFGYRLAKFSELMYSSIAKKLLDKYLKMQYVDFVKRGPTFIQKILISETYNFTHIISAGLMFFTEFVLLSLLCILLLITDVYATLAAMLFLGASVFFIKKMITSKMSHLGYIREVAHKYYYESISNIFRNFKYIKTINLNKFSVNQFDENINRYVESNLRAATLSLIPRSMLEFLGYFVIIALFIYALKKNDGSISEALPVLSMFALGLTRLLPSVNRIITSYNQILFHKNSLRIIYEEVSLKSREQTTRPIKFLDSINIENLLIYTNEGQLVIKNGFFLIKKNAKIGIVGASGSGKSTLIDVILGLHKVEGAIVKVDGLVMKDLDDLNLKSITSFIPQKVYLFRGTVGQNVAMSNVYDINKVQQALKKVDLDFVFQDRDGLDTEVGEDGLMLSGGQLQRIGIARALYQDSEIIIMDEPTSSVDSKTAEFLMNKVYEVSENKTLIIVSHQINVLNFCDYIYKINKNTLTLAG